MKMKIIPICLLLILLIAGCVQEPTGDQTGDQGNNDQVACAEDAKTCPDGTTLSRVPPECNFPDCPETGLTIPEIVDQLGKKGETNFTFYGNVTNIGGKTGDALITVTLYDGDRKEIASKSVTVEDLQPEQIKSFVVYFELTRDQVLDLERWERTAERVV